MPNPWEKYQEPVSSASGNPWDKYGSENIEPVKDKSLIESASDALTGSDRQTEATSGLVDITGAPELGGISELVSDNVDSMDALGNLYDKGLSMPAFKTAAAMLTTGDPERQMKAIKSNYPDATFKEDEKGNVIVGLESGEYALNLPGVSASDVTRLVTDIAAFTPAGRAATVTGAALKSAATEGALQASTQAAGGGNIDTTDMLYSGLLGGAGKGLEKAVTTGYRMLKGAPTEVQSSVSKFAQEQDLPLMTTDVVQPKTFAGKSAQAAGEKIPVAGTGAKRAEQQQAREQLVEDFSNKFGEYDPSVVVESLKAQTSKIKQAAGNARQAIVDQIGTVKTPSANTVTAIDDEVARLSKLGDVADTQTIETLNKYKAQLQKGDRDFNQLEQLRTQFRQDVKGERMVMPSRSQAAISKIYKAMSDDMNNTVSTALGPKQAAKWKKSNAVYAEEANKVKNTRLKSILNKGDLTPEVVNNMLFSNKPSEVKALFSSLTPKGKEAARSGLVGKAWEKSKGSPDKFLGELNRLSKQTDIAFRGADRAYVNGLKEYLQATKRAGEAGVKTATGQELFQIAAPAAIIGDVMTTSGTGVMGAGGYGLLARAYESKPVRVAMMKLSTMKPGTTQFEKQSNKIGSMITSASQHLLRQEE